jgi:hypothetical protein
VSSVYAIEDLYKVNFFNPSNEKTYITTNLKAGKIYDANEGKLLITIPENMGVNTASLTIRQLEPTTQTVLAASPSLEWVAVSPEVGVYVFEVQINTAAGDKTLSGQFIVE